MVSMVSWVPWKSWLACAEPSWELWSLKGHLVNSLEELPLPYYYVFCILPVPSWSMELFGQSTRKLTVGNNPELAGGGIGLFTAAFQHFPPISRKKNFLVKKVQKIPMPDFLLCLPLFGLCRPDKVCCCSATSCPFVSRKPDCLT